MTRPSDRLASPETFESIQKRLLIERLDRLRKLIDLNAPAPVVSLCIPGVVAAAASVYGAPVFERIGEVIVHQEKSRLGFCPHCDGTPNRVSETRTPFGESWGMCDACLASVADDEDPPEAVIDGEVLPNA